MFSSYILHTLPRQKLKPPLKFRTIINLRNRNGNTAMELATLYWPQSVVDCIVALGAKAGFEEKTSSEFNLEKSIDKILPATLENFIARVTLRAKVSKLLGKVVLYGRCLDKFAKIY